MTTVLRVPDGTRWHMGMTFLIVVTKSTTLGKNYCIIVVQALHMVRALFAYGSGGIHANRHRRLTVNKGLDNMYADI